MTFGDLTLQFIFIAIIWPCFFLLWKIGRKLAKEFTFFWTTHNEAKDLSFFQLASVLITNSRFQNDSQNIRRTGIRFFIAFIVILQALYFLKVVHPSLSEALKDTEFGNRVFMTEEKAESVKVENIIKRMISPNKPTQQTDD